MEVNDSIDSYYKLIVAMQKIMEVYDSIDYWDEPYKIQPWEDGTTSPICRCQENYFKEFNENFL